MNTDRGKWALRTLLEAIKGPFPDPLGYPPSESDRGLIAWYRFNYYMARDDLRRELAAHMTVEQQESYRLLHDWWTAAYQDPAHSLGAIIDYTSDFGDFSETEIVSEGHAEEAWALIRGHLRLKRWPNELIPKPAFTGKLWDPGENYNLLMESLFRLEFTAGLRPFPRFIDTEPADIIHYRVYFREQGVKYAYCQELGYKLYSRAFPQYGGEKQSEPNTTSVGARPGAANPVLTRGPVLKPCPWLDKGTADKLHNLPLYLWDVANGKTILSTVLKSRPEYTAISHTWGRWIQDAGNPVSIPGARWKIPRNTRFDVTSMAQLLRQAPCGTPYVWLDLVCIPQHPCAEQASEIGRQAKIFQGAKHVVAWLNDVDDFDGLRLITQWQALQVLRFSSSDQSEHCRILVDDLNRNVSGKQTGLMSPGLAALRPINPWFTSLWTLQEAAMRPDMWLCARDWTPLTWDDGGGAGSPLPLSGFLAVLDVFKTWAQSSKDTSPRIGTYQQLNRWSITSGLERLLDLDRTSLITLGDRRECTGRRAEAIMSALGVTDWYDDALRRDPTNSDGPASDLVLGKYPRPFVQECAAKFPGEFFGSTVKVILDGYGRGQSTEAHGTLLPFNRGRAYQVDATVSRETRFPMKPHDSLHSWTVLASGAVRVPGACVLGSSGAGKTATARVKNSLARLRARLPLSSGESAYTMQEEDLQIYDSLDELIGDLKEADVEVYAILTEFHFLEGKDERPLVAMGMVLERSPSGNLRKKHHFWFCDQLGAVDVSNTQRVNWTID